MKKILAFLSLSLLLAGCAKLSSNPDLYAPMRQATHVVIGAGQGSGVVIQPGLVITAAHVVGDRTEVTVAGKPGKVIRSDAKTDIALLEVSGLACPCVPLAEVSPSVDEKVVVVGFPLYGEVKTQIVTEGRVQGVVDYHILLNVSVAPGNSGGGTFTSENGEWRLVGVLVQVACLPGMFGECLAHVNHISKAVGLDAIRLFINS